MKKLFAMTAIAVRLFLSSCADKKTINGVTYRPYGLLNEDACKNDSIEYTASGKAIFSGIFWSECCLIPTVYTFGFNLWEPVRKKSNKTNHGVVKLAKK